MEEELIRGRWRIESDMFGSYYKIAFKPDHEQIGYAQPTGFILTTKNPTDVLKLVGAGREPELSRARHDGWVEFSGEVSRETYLKHSRF